MGASFGDLEPRQMDRLRIELAEVLAANVAYPPFFDYRTGAARTRPVDRVKRDEIDNYLRSVNFEPIIRVDITSPEVRRFLERLMLRYIAVNPALAHPRLARRLPELRSRVPRMAGEVHRGLVALLSGDDNASFGARRQQPSWAATSSAAATAQRQVQPRTPSERNTRVLEAILLRQELGIPNAPVSSPLSAPAPNTASAAHGAFPTSPPSPSMPATPHSSTQAPPAWLVGNLGSGDLTVPVPAQGWPAPTGESPFAGLESGAQSSVFSTIGSVDDTHSISDRPTGPLPIPPGRTTTSSAPHAVATPGAPRELPPDLYQLYGDYLRDMEPEVEPPVASAPLPGLTNGASAASKPALAVPSAANGTYNPPSSPSPSPSLSPAGAPASPRHAPASDGDRSDKLIFWQLRYQLEAYVRRAAQSYGVRGASDDPFSMLDALRRSAFVDEADLRIAEGILALTDRVTASGSATVEDYRQAFLLYLLYHRSHLGV